MEQLTEEYEEENPSVLEILAALTGSQTIDNLSALVGDSRSGTEMGRSAAGTIQYQDQNEVPSPQEDVKRILTALTSTKTAEEMLANWPAPVVDEVMDPTKQAAREKMAPKGTPLSGTDMEFLRAVEKARGWTPAEITTDSSGKRSIVIQGNSTEFQGLGKYGTPEEFMRANPDGFRAANPLLAAQMEARAKATAQVFQSPIGSVSLSSITDQVNALKDIKDPDQMFKAVANIESSMAKAKQEYLMNAKKQAEAHLGIPTLTEMLRQSELRDRQHPMFMQSGGKDSIETTTLKKQLQAAQKAYASTVKEMVAGNPMLTELESVSRLMSRTAEFRMKQLEKDLTKEEAAQAKVDQEYTMIRAKLGENFKYMPMLFPGTFENKAVFNEQIKSLSDKDSKMMMDAMQQATESPQNLPSMAVMGNNYAREILLKQHELNGGNTQKAKADLADMERITNSAQGAAEALKELKANGWVPKGKEAAAAFEANVNKYANPAMDKALSGETLKEAKLWRLQRANEFIQMKKEKEINSDVSKLNSPAARPAWLDVYATDPKLNQGKKPSLDSVIAYINSKDDFQQRKQMMDEFKAYYGGAISESNKSGLGYINPMAAMENLKVKAAQNWLSRSMSIAGRAIEGGTRSFLEAGAPLFNEEIRMAFPLVGAVSSFNQQLKESEK